LPPLALPYLGHIESRKATTGEEIYMLFFGMRIVPGVGYSHIRGLFDVCSVSAFCYS
jgi:hypothetical protein